MKTVQTVSVSLIIPALLSGILGCTGGMRDSQQVQAIDTLFSESFGDSTPGAAVIVKRDDVILLRKGYGLTDVESGVPITPETVFRVATVTKQFTAMSILLLAEEGKLSLTDPITAFLPDYDQKDGPITIEHLLTHTSGITSYTDLKSYWKRSREELTRDEMIALFQHEPSDFPPGEGWSYNNSGYFLLGVIIERVSGIPYEQFIRNRILDPLGLDHTCMDSNNEIIPGRASGYTWHGERLINAEFISASGPFSAGGLVSTVDDLARWDDALYAQTLVSSELLNKCFEPVLIGGMDRAPFAFGWGLRPTRGHDSFVNVGFISGFKVCTVRVPSERIFVAVLENSVGRMSGPEFLARKAAAIAMGDPYPPRAAVQLPPEQLDALSGIYRSEQGFLTTIIRDGNQLMVKHSGARALRAFPSSSTSFFYPQSFSHIRFDLDENGEVRQLVLNYDADSTVVVRTEERLPERPMIIDLESSVFARYEGSYEIVRGHSLRIYREVVQRKLEEHSFGIISGLQRTVFHQAERYMFHLPAQAPLEILPQSDCVFFTPDCDTRLEFKPCGIMPANEVHLLMPGGLSIARRISTDTVSDTGKS